jgi:hypothetical protein
MPESMAVHCRTDPLSRAFVYKFTTAVVVNARRRLGMRPPLMAGDANTDEGVHLGNTKGLSAPANRNGCQRSRQASAERELVRTQHNSRSRSGAANLASSGTWIGAGGLGARRPEGRGGRVRWSFG